MRHTWWISVGLVSMAWACTVSTQPQPSGTPPPHPYVQPAGPTPMAAAAGTTPAATPVDRGGPGIPAPPPGTTTKPTVPAPATPYDKPATKPPDLTTTKPAPATPYDPPGTATKVRPAGTTTSAPPPPPAGGGTENPDGKAAGAPCSMAKECQSNICEGQGCGYNAGRCAPSNRRCTRDLVAYCSCSGQTFGASGTCPGRIYRHKGVCKK